MKPSIFREYDIRGIIEKELSPELAKYLGIAFAKYLKSKLPIEQKHMPTIAVGRDCRFSGESYAHGLIAGLTEQGVNVVVLGVCPTPLTYFSLFHLNLDGGIMITGSHNPPEYNGYKICVGKETIHGHQIQELRQIMEALTNTQINPLQPEKRGNTSEYPIINAYIDYLIKNSCAHNTKKIVLDAGNGVAGCVAPAMFQRLGATVIPLYCDMDGSFPNHHPDPTVPANLKDLIATVKKENADFGIAFDGDADRIGLVDERGNILFGDELMVIFSRAVLKDRPGATIISEVKSSHRLYNDILAHGGKPLMWKTGHSLIKAKMKETKAALAGEMSGHIFFADRYFGYDDAIYAALRFYEIAGSTTKPASSFLEDLPKTIATPEIRIECEEASKFALVEETKRHLSGSEGKINDIDGIRIDFGDGWGLLRASNTQPVLVLRFEAPTEPRLIDIKNKMETALQRAAKTLGHVPLVL
ncbi:MAG: phosphomannomutase/phosphoglucomutase [Candidatus Poribacteria bacterium]